MLSRPWRSDLTRSLSPRGGFPVWLAGRLADSEPVAERASGKKVFSATAYGQGTVHQGGAQTAGCALSLVTGTIMLKNATLVLSVLGGARRDAVARTPHGAAQAATLGALLLITATIAAFTGGYAVHRVFLGSPLAVWIAAAGGTLWGSFVFCVDRGLILGIDKAAGPRRLAFQVLVRVPLAIVVALVMSTPFVLKVCEGPIRLQLRQERQDVWLKEIASLSHVTGLTEFRKTISDLRATRDLQRERLLREPDSYEYRQALQELRAAEGRLRSLDVALRPKINEARAEIQRLFAAGRPHQGRADILRRQIADWQAQLDRAQSSVAQARKGVQRAAREWQSAIRALLETAEADISKLEPLQLRAAHRVAERGAQAEKELSELLRANLVNEYKALRRITSNPGHPDSAAIKTVELGLHTFFIILELTPVLMKALSRRTPLDVAMEAVEFLDAERVNLRANREALRQQKAAEVAAWVEAQALERWRDQQVQALHQRALTTSELERVLEEVREVAA